VRPLSLALEGFFAYRKPASIDLRTIDYFSLAGPTGSGKSSLIDAMVFALYGRVPRLGKNTIAPAISTGAERARVSFEFEVYGVEYTATRLLQRTKNGGATTKEARLESPGMETVSGAAEVTLAVVDLLRLTFEDFTRTVVLPQGDFARFLQAPPGERQSLLRGLLGLDIYGRVRESAREREERAKGEASTLHSRLADLELPEAEAMSASISRRDAIKELSLAIPAIEKVLADRLERKSLAEAHVERLEEAIGRLGTIQEPKNLGKSIALVDAAEASIDSLGATILSLEASRNKLKNEIDDLPSLPVLDQLENLYLRLDDVDASLEKSEIKTLEEGLISAESQVADALVRAEEAKQRLEAARTEHAAHELATSLQPGDICPVCQHEITATLDLEDGDVGEARVIAESAVAELEKARANVGSLHESLTAEKQRIESLLLKRKEVIGDLGPGPVPRDQLKPLRIQINTKSSSVSTMEKELEEAKRKLKDEEENLGDLAEGQRSLTNQLIAARDIVGDLKPEIPVSEDPAVGWKEFLEWRDLKSDELKNQLPDARVSVADAAADLAKEESTVAKQLAALDIPKESPISAAVARAETRSVAVVENYETAFAKSETLHKDLEIVTRASMVASTLKGHLNANGFERWMMVGAIVDLVSRANSVLADLSADSYSLQSDDNGAFDIVDHRNADEVRPISTLSGGETFMVSLALALALAETLSAGGAGQLSSIILDEGFGTLDGESIDVVASVLEGLTENGLMVGIITHVSELAARAPVRFQVRKGPDGSQIEGPLL
jgi:DNA repair protein SbcC/Rad50